MGQDPRYLWLSPTRIRYYNISFVVALENMCLRRIWDNHMHVDNRMEIVRHRTTVIWQSYDLIPIFCREAVTITWTRLQSYDSCAISYDVVRRRTRPWTGRAGENMWKYGTHIRDVAWRQTMSHDVKRWLYDTLASQPGFWTNTSCEAPRWLRRRILSHDYAQPPPPPPPMVAGGRTMW